MDSRIRGNDGWGFINLLVPKAFTDRLHQANIQISMDGRGRCHDNIFIERLWRSVKWELIYLKAFEDGQHLAQEVND